MSQNIQVKWLIVILALALSATAQAEYPVVEWTRQLGTSSYDYGTGVSVDGNGNAYVTGITRGGLDGNTNAGQEDMFLTKYDTDGAKLWTRQMGLYGNDGGYSVSVDSCGNAFVTGCTYSGLDGNTNAGYADMFLTKYDTNGDMLWTQQLVSVLFDEGYDVSVDRNGNAYVTGSTRDDLDGNTNMGYDDMFLTKYDTDGAKLWTQQLGSTGFDEGYGVSVDGRGRTARAFTNLEKI
ncbi:MAG: SBBP repeat-containing protein [Pirellulales bacterium]|nr:SBBP repeat-containing protein [Pirellulales bacterium]